MKIGDWICPVDYKVLVEPEVVPDKSAGGMYLPDSVRDRQQYAVDRGTIVAFGEGFFERLQGPTPKIGDKVIFSKYAGSLITVGEGKERKEYRLLNDEDICAILKEEKENG